MLTLLACIIAALALTVIFVFGSFFLFSAVVMTVAAVGNFFSGRTTTDDQPSPASPL